MQEINYIKLHYPTAQILILISSDDNSSVNLNNTATQQFGARMDELASLIQACKDAELKIEGIRFSHTHYFDIHLLLNSLKQLHHTMKESNLQEYIRVIDFGHEFASISHEIEEVGQTVIPLINALFDPQVEILANSAPYFDHDVSGLAVSILEKRQTHNEKKGLKFNGDVDRNGAVIHKNNTIASPEYIYYTADIMSQPMHSNTSKQLVIPLTKHMTKHDDTDVMLESKSGENGVIDTCSDTSSTSSSLFIGGDGLHSVHVYSEGTCEIAVDDWIYLPNRKPTTATKYSDASEKYYIAS